MDKTQRPGVSAAESKLERMFGTEPGPSSKIAEIIKPEVTPARGAARIAHALLEAEPQHEPMLSSRQALGALIAKYSATRFEGGNNEN